MKLLLVSPDREITGLCREEFASQPSVELLAVPDAGAALAVLCDPKSAFSHVLVDLRLPNSSGLIVCDAVGKSPQLSDAKLWTIDAGHNSDLFRTAHQLGAEKNIERANLSAELSGQSRVAEAASTRPPSAAPHTNTAPDQEKKSQKLAFSDKIRIGGVRDCVSRAKFDAYFAAMSKSEQFNTRIVALEITNAEAIFPKVTPDVFLQILRFVAQEVSEHFAQVKSKLTYNGNGVFICAFAGQSDFDRTKLVESIQRSSAEADMALQFISSKLTIHVGPVKRVAGVFKSHQKHQAKTPTAPPERKESAVMPPPVTPRRPRIQTRLLRAEDQIVLPRQLDGM